MKKIFSVEMLGTGKNLEWENTIRKEEILMEVLYMRIQSWRKMTLNDKNMLKRNKNGFKCKYS